MYEYENREFQFEIFFLLFSSSKFVNIKLTFLTKYTYVCTYLHLKTKTSILMYKYIYIEIMFERAKAMKTEIVIYLNKCFVR